MMELIDEFLAVLRESLDMLHNNDQYLINYEADEPVKNDEHVSELSISHKLSHYLELFVTEYHRNVADKKVWGRVVLDQILLFINVAIMRKILLL